jgi:dTDP-4-amino-4,6-dideoxygalactose transaminase
MQKDKIYLSSPHMSGNELDFVNEAFATNWVAPLGKNVNGLEEDIASYNNAGFCAALSSGTAALHLALIQLGVEQDDEVLCSTFTFSATTNAICYQKAIPVFIDSEQDTWNMDPSLLRTSVEERIAKGKKPKAAIIVHLYGMPSKMDELMAICKEFDIPVIEDAAEALGATYKNQKMGSLAKFGVYSFNGNKIITTSGGGALVCNDEQQIQRSRYLATQARDPAPHYQHSVIGYNYRMSNIVAGIGRGQMMVIDDRVKARRAMNMWYRELLANFDFIEFQNEPTTDYYSNYWLTCIVVNENDKGISRETIRLAMEKENIECRPLWKPMHQQPVFKDYPQYLSGVSDTLFEKGLCLPSGSNLTDDEKSRIKQALLQILS